MQQAYALHEGGGFDFHLTDNITVESYHLKGLPLLDPNRTHSFVVFIVNTCNLNFGDLHNSPHSQKLVNTILHVYRHQFHRSGKYLPYFSDGRFDKRTDVLYQEISNLIGNPNGITIEQLVSVAPDSFADRAYLRVELLDSIYRLFLRTSEKLTGQPVNNPGRVVSISM